MWPTLYFYWTVLLLIFSLCRKSLLFPGLDRLSSFTPLSLQVELRLCSNLGKVLSTAVLYYSYIIATQGCSRFSSRGLVYSLGSFFLACSRLYCQPREITRNSALLSVIPCLSLQPPISDSFTMWQMF